MKGLPYNLNVPLKLARDKLKAASPANIAQKKRVGWDKESSQFFCPFLSQVYRISYPSGEIHGEKEEEIDPHLKILFLHYLTSPGSSLHGQWITFKELPGGMLYSTPFYYRAILPLIRTFTPHLDSLILAGSSLGGERTKIGHASIILYPFPLVPVCLSLWAGDEEVPSGGTILFDASVPEHLSTEDCAVLAEYLVRRLKLALSLKE
ncbi:protein of unknown function [Thermanaeromonas toyohensis ToBE]|uniref:DUF3786 domain-containing protein n=1 Tax=Thermanaeromonas toyohensis ToBE TaxID=698762 RepID=A0A1W1VX50_9FIRM|nr:DUF3786 domain-containing protein [Thermanaeromonas toyohensis]SMB97908.1 protein of unknown function [Thermanaeromonas toyohensis ToBE]